MRPAPKITPPLIERSKPGTRGRCIEEREYELITPLFGGGVVPKEPDRVTTIRGPSIRGQLRFWWRACRVGRFETLDNLKAAEDVLWGAAGEKKRADKDTKPGSEADQLSVDSSPSITPVQIAVLESTPRQDLKQRVFQEKDTLFYAAFPLKPDHHSPVAPTFDGIRFTLRIEYSKEHADEVHAALWAWENLGGIGGRTRRGFGALRRTDPEAQLPPPTIEEARKWLRSQIACHVVSGPGLTDVPRIEVGTAVAFRGVHETADAAWTQAIDWVQRFRQQRLKNRYGRSLWPEAGAIRGIDATGWAGLGESGKAPDKFPRAAFGLPIIFHFKQQTRRREPEDSTLKLANAERLACPIILRPLACQGNRFLSMAFRLTTSAIPPASLTLAENKGDKRSISGLEAHMTPLEAKKLRQQELKLSSPDVLNAFLRFFDNGGMR